MAGADPTLWKGILGYRCIILQLDDFICEDGTFRRITPVNMWWHQLVLYLVLFEDCLHVSVKFVVKNVYIWCFTVGFE